MGNNNIMDEDSPNGETEQPPPHLNVSLKDRLLITAVLCLFLSLILLGLVYFPVVN
jgi:hypothetical protein